MNNSVCSYGQPVQHLAVHSLKDNTYCRTKDIKINVLINSRVSGPQINICD